MNTVENVLSRLSGSLTPLSVDGEVQAYRWAPRPGVRVKLLLSEQGVKERHARIVAGNPTGAFGPSVSAEEAGWRLLSVHLEEDAETGDGEPVHVLPERR